MYGFGQVEDGINLEGEALRTNASARDFKVTIAQTYPFCTTVSYERGTRRRTDAAALEKREVSKLLPAFHFTSLMVDVEGRSNKF